MSVQVCVLGSGSKGNCTYIGAPDCRILLDAGLSGRAVETRLAQIGVEIASIDGICVSHEHSDHTAGIAILHKRYGIPVYANSGTIEGMSRNEKLAALPWRIFSTGMRFALGSFDIEPFSVSHDAMDPVGFIIEYGDVRVGVLTDIGIVTQLIRERLRGCDAVVLESNHDDYLLQEAPRPWHLKQRIRGRQGHLSNQSAMEMVTSIADERLQHVFLAHLSEDCNRPDLALEAVRDGLKGAGLLHIAVVCCFPDRISEIWTYSALQ